MKEWIDERKNTDCCIDKEKENMRLTADMIIALIKRREKMGISQQELAKISGIKQPTISRIELGKNIPKMEIVNKLKNSLEVKIKLNRK